MNKCIFMGNLTKDFDISVNVSNNNMTIARGSMALNRGKDRDGKDRGADFINLIAFGKTAELMEKYGTKGRRFIFECHVNTGSYEKDGKKVYTTDFVIDRVEFADSPKTEETAKTDGNGFMPMDLSGIDVEELPFA